MRKLREPALAGPVGSGLDLLASWRARTSAAIRLRPGRGCSIVIRRRRGCTTRGFWDVNRMPVEAKRPVRLVLMDGLELNDPCVKPPIHRLAHGCSESAILRSFSESAGPLQWRSDTGPEPEGLTYSG